MLLERKVEPEALGSDSLCGCGCGQEVNPRLRQFRVMVAEGFTHYQIAAEHGVTREYVSSLIRKPPRYLRGHVAHVIERGPRPCESCGQTFKSQGPNHRHCSKTLECRAADRARKDEFWRSQDEAVAARVAERVARREARELQREQERIARREANSLAALERRERWLERLGKKSDLVVVRATPALKYEHSQHILDRLVQQRRRELRRGTESFIREFRGRLEVRRQALQDAKRARAILSGEVAFGSDAYRARMAAAQEMELQYALDESEELRELIEQQRKDERFGHYAPRWELSGNAPVSMEGDSATLFDFIADPAGDPYGAVLAKEISETIGGMSAADLAQASEETIEWLQHKLSTAGLVDISVKREERERSLPQRKTRHATQEGEFVRLASLGGIDERDFDEPTWWSEPERQPWGEEGLDRGAYKRRKRAREAMRAERRAAKKLRRAA